MTKAQTLIYIKDKLVCAKVLPLLVFKYSDFTNCPDKLVSSVQEAFPTSPLIFRSSSLDEDTTILSNAGKFKTVMNVSPADPERMKEAAEAVFSSYETVNDENEILVQPMLNNIFASGVVTTAELNTLSPYYVINIDESSHTDSVTSGKAVKEKTYISFKEHSGPHPLPYISGIINACRELERILENPFLDIEFGITRNFELYIFQVRPVSKENKTDYSSIDLKDSLRKIYKKIGKLSGPHPNLLGKKAIFGVMPDWNPAEIIGLRPKKLALSLYKELITDNTWAYQRDNYGYRNLRSHPLLISLLGIPYIDVRVSFNSFIPKSLDDSIAEKLVGYYLEKLARIPNYHDKVEFNVVHSCYYLNLSDKLSDLYQYGFNQNEIKRIEYSLLTLTNQIINPDNGIYLKDLKRIEILNEKYDQIINSDLPVIDKIYWLVEDCKRYGTLPFAGIARAAFIAVQFLRSFVDSDIITHSDYERLLNSINTVTKKLKSDLMRMKNGEISRDLFFERYGHLRPGTYDILSKRYDENFESYFALEDLNLPEDKEFSFSREKLREIDRILIENGIEITAEGLLSYIKQVIEGREYLKYVFSRSLSKVLQMIGELGNRIGMDTEDLAFLDFQRIKELYSSLDQRDVSDIFQEDIKKNKELYRYTQAVRLPSLIKSNDEIYNFFIDNEEPNFITSKSIEGKVLTEDRINGCSLNGQIVFIRSADPGYDFLFTKNISALVTQFGGVNSHMSIRCAELGIPAVIGAGEKKFQLWSKAERLIIDCGNKNVKVLI